MFITFEGPDGSGKTTQVQRVANVLRKQGHNILLTREPGGTDIGDQIRAILHSMDNKAMHPRSELLLYSASRAQLVAEAIRPHLDKGGIVLCDRFYDSTMAYQGTWTRPELRRFTRYHTLRYRRGLQPDLTVYLDIAPEQGLQRRLSAVADGEEWNRLDDMALAFHRRVREGYQQLIAAEPQRWIKIDGGRPQQAVERRHPPRFDDPLANSIDT